MDRLEKLKSKIKKEQHAENSLKSRYSKGVKSEAVRLQRELSLGQAEFARLLGVSSKSIQNWIDLDSQGKIPFKP